MDLSSPGPHHGQVVDRARVGRRGSGTCEQDEKKSFHMSDDPFEAAVNDVLGEEGGYVNNPADPGGETNWGISKRAFPQVDIKALTRDDAKALYRANYWDPRHTRCGSR